MRWDNSESDRSGLIYCSLVDGSKLQVFNQVHKKLGINPSSGPEPADDPQPKWQIEEISCIFERLKRPDIKSACPRMHTL